MKIRLKLIERQAQNMSFILCITLSKYCNLLINRRYSVAKLSSSAYGLKGRTIKWRILITHTLITKHLKQWRLLPYELDGREQYRQFLDLVKADLEERKQLFFGRPAYLYWSGANGLD